MRSLIPRSSSFVQKNGAALGAIVRLWLLLFCWLSVSWLLTWSKVLGGAGRSLFLAWCEILSGPWCRLFLPGRGTRGSACTPFSLRGGRKRQKCSGERDDNETQHAELHVLKTPASALRGVSWQTTARVWSSSVSSPPAAAAQRARVEEAADFLCR